MDYLIATHNKGKRAELQRILEPLGINIKLDFELGISLSEVEETGESFAENAYLKAFSGCRESGLPCIADDSGLMVDALDGRPGVYTARYGGEETDYPTKIELLIKELELVPMEKRTARFVSSICCCYPDGKRLCAEGKCEGYIGSEPKGEQGFGFDPIFYVGNKSFAQMSSDEKDAISHRGNSLRAFVEILEREAK